MESKKLSNTSWVGLLYQLGMTKIVPQNAALAIGTYLLTRN